MIISSEDNTVGVNVRAEVHTKYHRTRPTVAKYIDDNSQAAPSNENYSKVSLFIYVLTTTSSYIPSVRWLSWLRGTLNAREIQWYLCLRAEERGGRDKLVHVDTCAEVCGRSQ